MADSSHFIIAPYDRSHRAAVREVCVATAWMGACPEGFLADGWLWAEYWTRYFTDRCGEYCQVVIDTQDDTVAGYLTGTPDIRPMDRYLRWLAPGIIWRIIRKRLISRREPRRALMALWRSSRRGEMDLPDNLVAAYPATWHFNLLPAARGAGLGRTMLQTFLDRLRAEGVPGVHAQVIGQNRPSVAAMEAMGFSPAHTGPLTAFEHFTDQPLTLQTWVLGL